MSNGIKINNRKIVGTAAQLKLIKQKYKIDMAFRANVDTIMDWDNMIDPDKKEYTADELFNSMRNK